jgi:hypothetical protein
MGYVPDRDDERCRQHWRATWITRFTERQRRTRKWINFAEIAEWCSKEDQSIVPNKEKNATAFDTLARDLLTGEFEEGGRSLVLYLDAATATRRMTRSRLEDVIEHNLDGHQGRAQYLPLCWIPRRLFDRWLTKHRLEQSPQRFQPRCVERASTNASWKAAPVGAKTRGILDAINQLWPRGIPNGLSAKERDNAIRKQLEKNGGSIPNKLPRAVQRALKRAPPPK